MSLLTRFNEDIRLAHILDRDYLAHSMQKWGPHLVGLVLACKALRGNDMPEDYDTIEEIHHILESMGWEGPDDETNRP